MKNILHITALLILGTISAHAQTDTARWQWMHSIGGIGPGPNTDNQDNITDFRVDRYGNSYMAGWFYNSIDVQGVHMDVPLLANNTRNANNGFLVKFSCDGNVEWVNKWGSATGGRIWAIAPKDDYLMVYGISSTTVNYDCYIGDSITGNSTIRALAKYDLEGNLLWYKPSGNMQLAYNGLMQIDDNGNIYTMGATFYGPNTYDGVTFQNGFYLFKLDSLGNLLDYKYLNNTQAINMSFTSLEIDDFNNVYLTGTLDSAAYTFAGVQIDYGQGRSVSFLVKYDNNFNLQWLEQNHNIGDVSLTAIALALTHDNMRNTYCISEAMHLKYFSSLGYVGTIFQGDTLKSNPNYSYSGSANHFAIMKYNEHGNIEWKQLVSNNYFDRQKYPDIYYSNDTIIVSGLTASGSFNIGNFYQQLNQMSIFIIKFDLNGNILNVNFIPVDNGNGLSSYMPYSTKLSSNSNIYIVGTHQYAIQFPDSTLYPLKGSGSNRDIFIAKYGVNQCFRCDSVQLAFEVAQNIGYTAQVTANTTMHATSYEWDFGNGQSSTDSLPTLSIVYPDTGTYTVCLTAQNYCDTQTLCQQIHIGCPPPLANGYTYSTGNNSIEIETVNVQQYDSYMWYFGDGQSSIDNLPTHSYVTSGIYEVCMVAQNTCGVDSFCQNINITCPVPQIQSPDLYIDTLTIAGTGVNLQNQDSVYWSFGDGEYSTEESPIHTYAQAGIYNVCITIYNTCGDTTYCQQVSVVGTGIVQLINGGSVKLYPNPAQDYINIEVHNTEVSLQVKLIDLQGKVYTKTKIKSNKEQIDLSSLSKGIYFIHLKEKEQEQSVMILKE